MKLMLQVTKYGNLFSCVNNHTNTFRERNTKNNNDETKAVVFVCACVLCQFNVIQIGIGL